MGLPDLSVERSTTVERVVAALKSELLTGGLRPGMALRELELAEEMNVSRGSVREALVRLINEGLLRRNSYRSVVVTKLSAEEIKDLFVARRLLELTAVDSVSQATSAQYEQLQAACAAFRRSIREGTAVERHQADFQVHAALVGMLGSARLSQIHAGLMGELQLALTALYGGPDDEEVLINRHQEFFDLIQQGDIPAAYQQLETRLRASEANLIAAAEANE